LKALVEFDFRYVVVQIKKEGDMRRIQCVAVVLGVICGNAMAQSAGSIIATVGPAWLDYGSSSARELQISSAAGTFTSSGTGAEIHNTFTAEVLLSYFITDNITVELATGVPPKLKLYAQGTAAPLGVGGPTLGLSNLQPLATTRAWPPTLFFKYYFGTAQATFRPFLGVGVNYTWYTTIQLNPTFNAALHTFAGPGGNVKASLSPSWNPAFNAGFSYNLSKNWYATASLTYMPLKTNATISAVAANGQPTLVNKTRITANPWIGFIGIGYRF
jgi:outer membrane protein